MDDRALPSVVGRPWPLRVVRGAGWILGRSLFPFATLAILAGTLLWGPWVSLLLALGTWRLVVRHA